MLSEGNLRNEDLEKINEEAISFISQSKSSTRSTNSYESNGVIGVYAYFQSISIISFKETRGEIKEV